MAGDLDGILADLAPQPQQTAQPAFDPKASYGTPAKLLDNLQQTESSGDPYAVNKQTGAMGAYQFMPSTVAMLHKQGINFNPFDPQQARAAADKYIQTLAAQNGGDLNKAMAQYGGFVKQDPTAYVSKVMNGVQNSQPVPAAAPVQPGELDGILKDLSTPSTAPTVDMTPMSASEKAAWGAKNPTTIPVNAPTQPAANSEDMAKQANILPPLTSGSNLLKGIASVGDTVLGVIPAAANVLTYAGSRALQNSPDESDAIAGKVSSFLSNPIGKAAGITNDPAYQNEGSKQITEFIGENLNKGTQWLADKTGLPQSDVANIAGSLAFAAPGGIKSGAGAIKSAASDLNSQFQKLTSYRDAPLPPQYYADGKVPAANDATGMGAGAQAVQSTLDQGGRAQAIPGQPRQIVGGGAASANANPYPVLTGEEGARGPFPVVKLSKTPTDVSAPEQQARSQIVGQILGDTNRVRDGVITGNENTLRNEYTEAKSPNPTPKGELLKQQISDEQNALSNYAQQRVDATGALPTLSNDYQRGEFVNNVLTGPEGLTGHLQSLKQSIYDQARQTVGDNPVATTHLDALLSDPKFNAELKINGQKDFTGGLGDLVGVMKDTGFKNAPPNSVAAMEQLRQSLNRQWTPSNKNFIGQAIQAIDDDVATAGGAGLYEQGRAVHQAEKALFASKGIKTLFGDVDPNGVQTATPFEKIPQKLNDMPVDQWRHIYDTVDSLSQGRIPGAPDNMPALPPELQQSAAQAKNEMAGMLARKVYESGANKIGVWNQNSANAAMNALAPKIERAMPPDEQTAFHTLNYGGQIMPGVHSYEGSGLQIKRMADAGLFEKHAPAIGATLGELTHIPGAAWAGDKLGQNLSMKATMKRMLKDAQEADAKMEANSKLGKK